MMFNKPDTSLARKTGHFYLLTTPTPYFVWTVPAWFAWYLYATRAKGKAGGEDFAVSRQ
jgi:hypothetical protein